MSENNDRNREDAAREAAEEIQKQATPATEGVQPKRGESPKAAAEEPAAKKSSKKKSAKRRKRRRRTALLTLGIVLAVALVVLGILVGFGLGRVRSQREQVEEQAQVDELTAELNNPSFDEFTEALTNENQQALDALAGEDVAGDADADASVLLGEEGFDDAEGADGESAAEPVVVAEFGDGETLMSDEVLEAYNDQLSSFIISGYSEEEVAETLLDDVLESMVSDRVLAEHAREMGLYELTDEDRAQIAEQAQATYDEYVKYYDGEDESSLEEDLGISLESLTADLEQSWWQQKIYDAITADVTVDDAAVQAAYDAKLAEQKENFAAYPDDYEFSQRNGEMILYNPPGYRAVKMLLLGFDDEEAAMTVYSLTGEMADDGQGDAKSEEERQAQLDACYAGPEARAEQALEELRGGADMDAMIDELGQDEGMKDERLRKMGYYVSANSMLWSEDFVAAAMTLENVGDYSEPVRIDEGVCILQYLGEVSEGEVPLADVRDALEQEVLDEAKSDAYANQLQTWVDEAKPSYYPERMQ